MSKKIDKIEKELKCIVNNYPDAIEDSKRLKSILKDLFPDDKLIQNQLFMVVEDGILDDIIKNGTNVEKFKLLGYIRALTFDYGITEKNAKEAVIRWCHAYGISVEDVKISEETIEKKGQDSSRNNQIIDYSDNSIDRETIKGAVIRFSGAGGKVIPNVKLNNVTYLVKCSEEMSIKYYDCKRHSNVIISFGCECMWLPKSYLVFDEPGVLEVNIYGDKKKEWTVELIPI